MALLRGLGDPFSLIGLHENGWLSCVYRLQAMFTLALLFGFGRVVKLWCTY